MKTATISPTVNDFMRIPTSKLVKDLKKCDQNTDHAYHKNLFLAFLTKSQTERRSIEQLAIDFRGLYFPKHVHYTDRENEGEMLFCDLIVELWSKNQQSSIAHLFPEGSIPYSKFADIAA